MVCVKTGPRSGGLWLGPLTSFSLLFCRTGHYPKRPAMWSYTWSQTAERCHGQWGGKEGVGHPWAAD